MAALLPEKIAVSEDYLSQDETAKEKELSEGLTKEVLDNTEIITAQGNIITKDGLILNTKAHYDDLNGPNHIFSDPEVAKYYVDLYEKAHYESRHVFDPTLTWTKEEERVVIRKLDWRVCAWACTMFFALQVDRGNLTQAVADNLLKDLKLTTNNFNLGNSIFLAAFACAELPSQLVSKKLGPDVWIPLQMVIWSVVAMSQVALSGKKSFYATRAILGALEGGFIPDIVLWLSYFYTGSELPIRLSYFWTTLSLTTVLTSLLAYAIFHLEGVHGWQGWRWLFLLEGLITLVVGLASFFLMPASAVQTKTWFRPNGWFTDRETAIVVNRVLRDDPSKGDMHNRQAITPRRLWHALQDYDLWPLYLLGFLVFVPVSPPATYITLTLKSLGFSTFNTTLLTIPPSILHIINLIIITRISHWLSERTLVAMIQPLWSLPPLLVLAFWPGTIKNAWGTYATTFILLGYPYCHAILVAWSSKNANNVGSRSVSAALYNMSVQLGGIWASFIYQTNDAPKYRKGNRNLVIINVVVIFVFLATKFYYVSKNKNRDKKWKALTAEEQTEYLKNTPHRGSRRLNFRFAH